MKCSLLSWSCSFLTLHSVSFSATTLTFAELPNEMQLAIMDQVDFCDYIEGLKIGRGVPTNTDVGMAMLVEVAKEEVSLGLHTYRQRARKQRILKSVRTFVRISSRLPIVCKTTDKEELERLAKLFESTYQRFSSFSESPTWKKACMAGLFGRNTLITLLPHLSEDFFSHNKDLLLQTALFIGDIDSLEAITEFFGILKKDVPSMVSELDIVFSGSLDFFDELLERLPNVMEKRLDLIEEASRLSRLAIFIHILKVAKPAEPHELDRILGCFSRLKRFKDVPYIFDYKNGELGNILIVAAGHGHLPIIRFLWLAMEAMPNGAEDVVKEMLTKASRNNHRSVLEFLFFESGALYMNVVQKYVNDAFKVAVRKGNVDIMELLARKDNDGQFVAPGLCFSTVNAWDLAQIIHVNKNGDGIKYLVDLKKKGDSRFANFELVDQDNTALCLACAAGYYEGVDYLLRKTLSGEFVFPLTNPAANDNMPLVNACSGGNLWIVEKLLERDEFGNYVYEGIDPSAQGYSSIFKACLGGHLKVVEFLLKMNDAREYVLPGMNEVDLTRVMLFAVQENQVEILRFLLKTDEGRYVLPGMEGVDLTRASSIAIEKYNSEIAKFLLKKENGKYVLPGMGDFVIDQALTSAIRQDDIKTVRFLLTTDDGKYLLPAMEDVNLTQALLFVIRENRMKMVQFFLEKKDGNSVLPGENAVDFTQALLFAIQLNRREMVRLFLEKKDGKYVLPGIRVTEDMLTIPYMCPKMRELLEEHLE